MVLGPAEQMPRTQKCRIHEITECRMSTERIQRFLNGISSNQREN